MGDIFGWAFSILYIGLASFFFGLCAYDKIKGTHYSCDWMGWHNGKGKRDSGDTFDGCSMMAKCSKCGKDVMQDSQGNWF